MKKGKELNVNLDKDFKTYYGTIDNKDLKTIYIGISTWMTPLIDLDAYNKLTSQLRLLIKNSVIENVNSELFYPEHHIIDIDIKDSRIEFNKSSYLNIEITLFVKHKDSVLSNNIKNEMVTFITAILASINKSNHFNFAISKNSYECVS